MSDNLSKKPKLNKLKPLFWEYYWESVKEKLNSPFVIARVLEFATPEQFQIFTENIDEREILKFLNKRGKKLLSKRSLNFWKLYYEKKTKSKS